jgi:ABC-2 type transport system permease protein
VLDVYLAHPVPRRQFVIERFIALTGQIFFLGLVVFVVVAAVSGAMGLDVGVGKVAAASFGLALLGLCFATVALAGGGITGRRSFSLALSAGVAVVTYLLNAIVSQIEAVSGLKVLSPFYYYLGGDPLRNGYAVTDLLVLILIPAVLLAVTLVVFDRRDLNV